MRPTVKIASLNIDNKDARSSLEGIKEDLAKIEGVTKIMAKQLAHRRNQTKP